MTTFTLNLGALRVAEQRMHHVVEAAAVLLRDAVVETMDPGPPRTGEEYPIPGTSNATYTASAPGEPPAIREGIYRDSWQFSPAVPQGDVIRARAFTALTTEDGKHLLGEILEFGTHKMAPRPHVRPAMETARPAVAELVQRASA